MNNELSKFQSLADEIKQIIISGRSTAYQATNSAMIQTYWNIGKRIVEQEQSGAGRA